jgi:hypothetical protein
LVLDVLELEERADSLEETELVLLSSSLVQDSEDSESECLNSMVQRELELS